MKCLCLCMCVSVFLLCVCVCVRLNDCLCLWATVCSVEERVQHELRLPVQAAGEMLHSCPDQEQAVQEPDQWQPGVCHVNTLHVSRRRSGLFIEQNQYYWIKMTLRPDLEHWGVKSTRFPERNLTLAPDLEHRGVKSILHITTIVE